MSRPNIGRFYRSRRLFIRRLHRRFTHAEGIMSNILYHLGLRYLFQYQFKRGHFKIYVADFYIPRYNLVVEVDGGYHSDRKDYDQKRSSFLESTYSVKVIRFTNSEILNNPDSVKTELQRILTSEVSVA